MLCSNRNFTILPYMTYSVERGPEQIFIKNNKVTFPLLRFTNDITAIHQITLD